MKVFEGCTLDRGNCRTEARPVSSVALRTQKDQMEHCDRFQQQRAAGSEQTLQLPSVASDVRFPADRKPFFRFAFFRFRPGGLAVHNEVRLNLIRGGYTHTVETTTKVRFRWPATPTLGGSRGAVVGRLVGNDFPTGSAAFRINQRWLWRKDCCQVASGFWRRSASVRFMYCQPSE